MRQGQTARSAPLLGSLLITILFTASFGCGGGSSSTTTTTAAPTPTTPGAPPPAPPPPPTPPPPPPPPPVPVTPTEFLYAVVGHKADINGYSIDLSNGHLTLVAGSPFTVVANGQQAQTCTGCGNTLTSDPLGKFLFDAYGGNPVPGVVSFTVNPSSGALTQSDFKTPPSNNLSTDPQGRFLYGQTGDFSHPAATAFDINRSDGTLSAAPGSPYSYPPQGDTNIAPAASSNFAYTLTRCNGSNGCVGNDLTSHINGFSIDQMTGALVPLPGSPFAGGNLMVGLAMHPSGKFLYSEQQYLNGQVFDYEIVGFRVNTNVGAGDGSLTPLPNPQQTPDNGVGQLLVSPDGKFLYHTGFGHVRAYTIDQNTGALTLTGVFQPIGIIAIDATTKFLFSTAVTIQGGQAIANNAINVFAIDPNTGALAAIPDATMTTTETPSSLAVDKTQ